jgi:hypothetical protein
MGEYEDEWMLDRVVRAEFADTSQTSGEDGEFLHEFRILCDAPAMAAGARRLEVGWQGPPTVARCGVARWRERVDADMAAAGIMRVHGSESMRTWPMQGSASGSQQLARTLRLGDLMALMPLACANAVGIEELLEKALDCDAIHFDLLKPGAQEGKVQENAARWLSQTATVPFKVGITTDPHHRWSNLEYGYQHHAVHGVQYCRMVVLYASDASVATGMLEAALIAVGRMRYPDRCMNIASGGEAKKKSQTHFTYIVFG